MTFEEFFKKKKISLPALRGSEPALFTEFENHYAQMGEKSFDHTKKYWFNKLRRQYPLPPEEKPEKVRMENQLAEQTVTETIAQEASPVTRPGFTPRFKAPAKPATPLSEKQPGDPEPVPENKIIKQETDTAAPAAEAPKPAYKPKFKPPAKPAEGESTPTEPSPATAQAATSPENSLAEPLLGSEEINPEAAPKPTGFKPRFKPGVTPKTTPATAESEVPAAEKPAPAAATPTTSEPTEDVLPPATLAPKPAFKPRFKPGVTKPTTPPATDESEPAPPVAEPAAPTEQAASPVPPVAEPESPNTNTNPIPVDSPKPAYKPRFNPKMAKPKPPEE